MIKRGLPAFDPLNQHMHNDPNPRLPTKDLDTRALSCQECHLDKTISAEFHAIAEVVGACQVSVEGGGVKLRQHVYLADAAVDAVAHGDVDQSVGTADGHRRLGALLGERV